MSMALWGNKMATIKVLDPIYEYRKNKEEYFNKLCDEYLNYIEHHLQETNNGDLYEQYKSDPEFMKAYGMFLDWRGEHGQFILTNAFGITEKEVLELERYWKEHQD